MTDVAAAKHQLLTYMEQFSSCVVAMSAGVDSTVVAKAAQLAVGKNALAVTAVSPSLATGELEEATRLAKLIGIRHQVVSTHELQREGYRRNAADRCYFCKSELYDHLDGLLDELDAEVVFNGANTDDLGDHRPGMQAAAEHRVRSPLLECEIDKSMVRQLASSWCLPVWDKPATPCLSSRIAYGEEVTPQRLQMIDQAEQFIRSLGLRELRVRYHRGDLARIEVPSDQVDQLSKEPTRTAICRALQEAGFRFVTIDLAGFRSGSLNALVELEIEP